MATHTQPAVCTLATYNALKDLKVFFFTLTLFNPVNQPLPAVYIICESEIETYIKSNSPYTGPIHCYPLLDYASGLTRSAMERIKGKRYPTMWEDFMMEKATIIDIAFTAGAKSVYLFDSDICFLGPLPAAPNTLNTEAKIGVCPHMIRPSDEAKYGRYNAGYVWTSDPTMPTQWRKAAENSYFYDQAALETIVNNYISQTPSAAYMFPVQNNYGWWRMFQGIQPPTLIQATWSVNGTHINSSGICVEGSPLLSVHTHWQTTDFVTAAFNSIINKHLSALSKFPKAQQLNRFLQKEFYT
jgi:hypothetical protein